MINYKNLYAGSMVLNEFKDKLKALCDEYTRKRDEACPENYASGLWDEGCQCLRSIRIQFSAEENGITVDELVSENFIYQSSNDTSDYYEKNINGIKNICSVKKTFAANSEDNTGRLTAILKNLYAGAMVLNEFKDKLKALCDEYTRKRDEACPENCASGLWDEDYQTVKSVWILILAEANHITRDELVSENFAYKTSDTSDWYEKEINGIMITFSIDKPAAKKSHMTEKEKANEVDRIIASLREKYSLEDIIFILRAARIKANTLMYCKDCLDQEETDNLLIDESGLPF